MTEREREIAIAASLAQEAATGVSGWWWLSFADGTRPRGEQFLGAVCVRALGMGTAIREAHRLGINPGGAVQASALPEGIEPPMAYCNRLLTREDVAELQATP